MSKFSKSVIPFNHNEIKGTGKTSKNEFTLMKMEKKSLYFLNGNSKENDDGDKKVIIS